MNLQWNGLQNDFSEIRGSINLKQQLLSNKFKRKYILSNLHSINRKLIIYSIYICYIISNIYYRESNHSSNNINYIIYRFKLLDIKFQIFYAFFFFYFWTPVHVFRNISYFKNASEHHFKWSWIEQADHNQVSLKIGIRECWAIAEIYFM